MNRHKLLLFSLCLLITLIVVAPAVAQTPTDVKVWIAFTNRRLDWAKDRAAELNTKFP